MTRHAAHQTADAAAIQVIDFPDLSLERPLWRIKARRNAPRVGGQPRITRERAVFQDE